MRALNPFPSLDARDGVCTVLRSLPAVGWIRLEEELGVGVLLKTNNSVAPQTGLPRVRSVEDEAVPEEENGGESQAETAGGGWGGRQIHQIEPT